MELHINLIKQKQAKKFGISDLCVYNIVTLSKSIPVLKIQYDLLFSAVITFVERHTY